MKKREFEINFNDSMRTSFKLREGHHFYLVLLFQTTFSRQIKFHRDIIQIEKEYKQYKQLKDVSLQSQLSNHHPM